MNPDDLAARSLANGSMVDICGPGGRSAPAFRAVAYDVPRGCAAAYFPETNVLVPFDSVARGSNTPTSKMVPVTVTAARGA
jgi:anaerobic selenocysteine-containing dehydrogenase